MIFSSEILEVFSLKILKVLSSLEILEVFSLEILKVLSYTSLCPIFVSLFLWSLSLLLKALRWLLLFWLISLELVLLLLSGKLATQLQEFLSLPRSSLIEKAATSDTLIFKEILTSSISLPWVHNNYKPIITLIASLSPILYLKYEADKEREKIVSIVLSNEDVEIFCEGMRDIEELEVDLEIEQDERNIFGLEDVKETDNSIKKVDDCWVPKMKDISPNFN
ncbi:hypothetical protein BDZ91DRAFT_769152 [Kalaharituber pfeilii]|nr:hypothetical protein BDZ91DRAFT_769152 [Kalaharituber pfeilii]